MTAYHPDAERAAKAAACGRDDAAGHRHLACEILASLPLLRAIARIRSLSRAEADALTRATVQQALAEPAHGISATDLRPWLLGLQRAIHEARRDVDDAHDSLDTGPPARGAGATWQRLHRALLRLPDRQREALVLADGAYVSPDELAAILGTSPAQARRLVRHARAALLARLAMARHQSLPPAQSPGLRRPGRQCDRPRHRGAKQSAHGKAPAPRPTEAQDERQAFARRLNSALLRALLHDTADPADRRDLETLLVREKWPADADDTAAGRGCRTSWLRLMFIAYACPADAHDRSRAGGLGDGSAGR